MRVFDPYDVPTFAGPTGGGTEATSSRPPVPHLARCRRETCDHKLIDHTNEHTVKQSMACTVPGCKCEEFQW